MKRARHQVDVFCEMFTGWRLVNSLATIDRLGSGVYSVNLLSNKKYFNGCEIDEFKIGDEIYFWFLEDSKKKTNAVWTSKIKGYKRFSMDCEAAIKYKGKAYRKSKFDLEEFPYEFWNEYPAV